MKWSHLFAVVALWVATPAAAQIYQMPYYPGPGYPNTISSGQAMAAVQSVGLRPVSEPDLRGPVWVVRAIGRDGELVRAVVDSQSGRVVNITTLDRPVPPEPDMTPGGRKPRVVTREPHYDGPYENREPEYRGTKSMPPYGSNQPPYDEQGVLDEEDEDQPIQPPGGRSLSSPNSSLGPQISSQSSAPKNVDPLLGVPPEFRGKNAKLESKSADKPVASKTSTVPLPKARPDDSKKDQGPTIATGPKKSETMGSILAPQKKTDDKPVGETKNAADEIVQ